MGMSEIFRDLIVNNMINDGVLVRPDGISDEEWNIAMDKVRGYYLSIAKSIIEFFMNYARVDELTVDVSEFSGTPSFDSGDGGLELYNSFIAPLVNHLNYRNAPVVDKGRIKFEG